MEKGKMCLSEDGAIAGDPKPKRVRKAKSDEGGAQVDARLSYFKPSADQIAAFFKPRLGNETLDGGSARSDAGSSACGSTTAPNTKASTIASAPPTPQILMENELDTTELAESPQLATTEPATTEPELATTKPATTTESPQLATTTH